MKHLRSFNENIFTDLFKKWRNSKKQKKSARFYDDGTIIDDEVPKFSDFSNLPESGDDLANKIVKELISRLKKVKDHNPYKIEKENYNDNEYRERNIAYTVYFDDVKMMVVGGLGVGTGYSSFDSDDEDEEEICDVLLFIDSEKVDAYQSLIRKLYDIIDTIYLRDQDIIEKNKRKERLSRVYNSLNPAADKLRD